MKANEPSNTGGLPDAGGLNIDYQDTIPFEPTEDQLELVQADVKTIANSVRTHLTDAFTVTTRLNRTPEGPLGCVIVEFPSGDRIGPSIPITADMFDGADDSDWDGPIPPEEIETLSREITTATVTQWAEMLENVDGGRPLPAS